MFPSTWMTLESLLKPRPWFSNRGMYSAARHLSVMYFRSASLTVINASSYDYTARHCYIRWPKKLQLHYFYSECNFKTRSALSRANLPPTTVFRRLKTTRRCFDGRPILVYVGFLDIIKFRVAVHSLWEKAIRFRHPDYDPDRAQNLTSSSMSPVDTQHFIQIHARVFE